MQPWPLIVLASVALATMPQWWPAGYQSLFNSGARLFRAPARYTVITSLGLALLAGSGLDRAISSRRFAAGLLLAAIFAATAAVCALWWTARSGLFLAAAGGELRQVVSVATLTSILSLCVVWGWRVATLGHAPLFLLAAVELAVLYQGGPTSWGRAVNLPDQSPVPGVSPASRPVGPWPVRWTTCRSAPTTHPPIPISACRRRHPTRFSNSQRPAPRLPSLGLLLCSAVTASAMASGMVPCLGGPAVETLYQGPDEALDRVVHKLPDRPIVRAGIWCGTWTCPRPCLCVADERPPELPDSRSPAGRIVSWDDLEGQVEHDGVCDVVIRRTYTPGWTARVDEGPEIPVVPVDGGLQSVRLTGSGRTRVALHYRPPRLTAAAVIP